MTAAPSSRGNPAVSPCPSKGWSGSSPKGSFNAQILPPSHYYSSLNLLNATLCLEVDTACSSPPQTSRSDVEGGHQLEQAHLLSGWSSTPTSLPPFVSRCPRRSGDARHHPTCRTPSRCRPQMPLTGQQWRASRDGPRGTQRRTRGLGVSSPGERSSTQALCHCPIYTSRQRAAQLFFFFLLAAWDEWETLEFSEDASTQTAVITEPPWVGVSLTGRQVFPHDAGIPEQQWLLVLG